MEETPPGAPGSAESMRERLRELERRVDDLERAAERDRRARSRSRLVFLVGVALYVLALYWELTRLV